MKVWNWLRWLRRQADTYRRNCNYDDKDHWLRGNREDPA